MTFQEMTTAKQNLIGLAMQDLSTLVGGLGERPYRGGQIFRWLYQRGATSFEEMTDVARSFRQQLASIAEIRLPVVTDHQLSAGDGTTKFLFTLDDGRQIETVYIPHDTGPDGDARGRRTLCVSTQVGCPLDCAFCATGTMGYTRNLTTGEILGQVLQAQTRVQGKITNVVFMGMGEPMLNYDAMMAGAEILTTGVGIAARRITISTAGWVEGIRRMADERRRNKLAVSLHGVCDEVRTRLMPINKRFPLRALQSAVAYYYSRTHQRVTYEYIFFDGVNDGEEDVRRLIRFARSVPCKVNVIPYHSIAFTDPAGFGATLRSSPRTESIVRQLRDANITVMVRSSSGADIHAACGQLAAGQRPRASRGVEAGHPHHDRHPQPHVTQHATSSLRSARSRKRDSGKTAL